MRRYLAVALAATCCGVVAAPAAANHSWNGYHWARTANPFGLSLADNVGPAWDTYLATASANWSKSTVLDTTVVPSSSKRNCRATGGRIEVCDAAYGNNGWLGLATIWISGGTHITQGTVKMNDTYFGLAAYNSPQERHHTMCQEVGHEFGLDHQSTNGTDLNTCMDYAAEPQANNTSPNQHDYDELLTIYNHLDATATIQSSAQANTTGANPYRTERTDNRHESTVTEYFSDDSRRVTRIVWAS